MLSRSQYRKALKKLKLTQVGFAELVGVHDVTARRWAKHGCGGPAAILLCLAVTRRVRLRDIDWCRARAGQKKRWKLL